MSYLYAIKNIIIKMLSKRPIVKPVHITQLQMPNMLEGRSALITGGTSGIGYSISCAMYNAGADIVITGRSQNHLNNAVERILQTSSSRNGHILGIVMDMKDVDKFDSIFQHIINATPQKQIDILVNNAGVQEGCFGTTKPEQYDAVLDTNLRGVYFLSQITANYMKDNHIKGNILNIASASSNRPANSPYILSKWGIKGLTLGLAKMLIPYEIVVNGIAPGPTATPMLQRDETQGIESDRNPMGRLVSPHEIANMAVILTSGLGRSIVGDIVYMTGGASLITLDDVECKI